VSVVAEPRQLSRLQDLFKNSYLQMNNSTTHLVLPSVLALILSGTANAQATFVETFETGTNVGAWSWGTGNEAISPLNGNPGAFLQDLTLHTCCPAVSTQFGTSSIFTGDYQSRGITSLGLDLVTLDADLPVGDRKLSVLLINDNGSPGNFDDDFMAYFIGDIAVPEAGVSSFTTPAGWTAFDFAIPSHMTTLPQGWLTYSQGSATDDQIWNDVIRDVDTVQYFYGDPLRHFLFSGWDVGTDNLRISFLQPEGTPFCFGDGGGTACPCGNSGAPGGGCLNSAGTGAVMSVFGTASAGNNSLVLRGAQAVPSVTGLFFGGTAQFGAGNGIVFGDGLLCAGGSITRLQIVTTDALGNSSTSIDIAAKDGAMPGDLRYYQLWYRDNAPGPCNSGFNTSNAVALNWQL
jgi:hypothetical protein